MLPSRATTGILRGYNCEVSGARTVPTTSGRVPFRATLWPVRDSYPKKSARFRRRLLRYENGHNPMRWNCFHAVIFLPYLLTPMSAQVTKPLATQSVECARDQLETSSVENRADTGVRSEQITRAYGVVAAEYGGQGSCKNVTSVYIAGPQLAFKLVFKQVAEPLPDGTVYDGNGIQAIRWLPSGKHLLIEVSQWTWGTDSTWNIKYMLLNHDGNALQQILPENAIWKRSATPCQMSVTSKGWSDDSHIEFEVNPTQDVDVEGVPEPEPPCVEHTTNFTFDVVSRTLRP